MYIEPTTYSVTYNYAGESVMKVMGYVHLNVALLEANHSLFSSFRWLDHYFNVTQLLRRFLSIIKNQVVARS